MRTFAMILTVLLGSPMVAASTPLHSAARSRDGLVPAPLLLLELKLVPEHALPGVPRRVDLKLTNLSSETIDVPDDVMLVRHTSDGAVHALVPYVDGTLFDGGNCALHIRALTDVQTLATGRAVTFSVESDGNLGNQYWFADAVWGEPGDIDVSALVGSGLNRIGVDAAVEHSVGSNVVRVTVDKPAGVDAEVWKAIFDYGGGRMSIAELMNHGAGGPALLADLADRYPASSYTGWLVTIGAGYTSAEKASRLSRWLSESRPDAYTDWRWFRLAEFETWVGKELVYKDSPASSVHFRRAQAILDRLARETRTARLRLLAVEKAREAAPE